MDCNTHADALCFALLSQGVDAGLNVLVVGGGGREHALTWRISQSPRCDRVFCIPGNAGTAKENKVGNKVEEDKRVNPAEHGMLTWITMMDGCMVGKFFVFVTDG